jgi:uncharacterized protein DUF5678
MPKQERKKLASSLKTAEDNMKWLVNNYDKLKLKYRDSWVAVRDGKVVAADKDHARLLKMLEEVGDNTGPTIAIDFIGTVPPNFLL